jgi:predicted aspartyl protease
MGQFQLAIEIREPRSWQSTQADLLVDTGALYTSVPAATLDQISVLRLFEQDVTVADGRKLRRWVGDVIVQWQSYVGLTPVIFGEPDDVPVLGAMALQSMGLAVDPVRHCLIEVARIQAAGL